MHACMYVRMSVCIYTYIHTHMHPHMYEYVTQWFTLVFRTSCGIRLPSCEDLHYQVCLPTPSSSVFHWLNNKAVPTSALSRLVCSLFRKLRLIDLQPGSSVGDPLPSASAALPRIASEDSSPGSSFDAKVAGVPPENPPNALLGAQLKLLRQLQLHPQEPA